MADNSYWLRSNQYLLRRYQRKNQDRLANNQPRK
jgi:hypothetical protein